MCPGGEADEVGVAVGYGGFGVVFDGEHLEVARELVGLLDGGKLAVLGVAGSSASFVGGAVSEAFAGVVAFAVVGVIWIGFAHG